MKKIIKRALSNIFTIKAQDNGLIIKIKESFSHNKRSFLYKHHKLLVDCIYCHASPGVIETTITELEKLKLNKEAPLLNLGGGTGQVADIFSSLGYEVFNVDIDLKPDQINDRNINSDLNSPEPIPFVDKQFDVVICQEIVEHLENPWQLFRNARKVLKDDGILVISTPNITSSFSKLRFLFTNYFNWFTPNCFTYHINPLPYWEIELIGQKTSFKLVELKGNGDFFFNKINQTKKQTIKNNEELIFIFKKI